MHIPDGYLSPGTCVVMYGAMAPVWYVAARRAERSMRMSEIPLLALGSAFVFVIMMFNIPVPGGTTGHMVGGAVVASVLGPWAGVMAMTIALTLQAFLFADGGLTTLGANCFNMAFLMSFSAWAVFRLVGSSGQSRARELLAAAAAGYVSVNVAAFAVAFELGIQPVIASTPEGMALYAPYPLSLSVPAMMVSHLLVFGPVEALGTALVVDYARRSVGVASATAAGPAGGEARPAARPRGGLKRLWAALLLLVLITPIGLMATGTPWGEWTTEEVEGLVGYVPGGMAGLAGLWRGILPDYALPGAEGGALSAAVYIAAALVGSIVTISVVYVMLTRGSRR